MTPRQMLLPDICTILTGAKTEAFRREEVWAQHTVASQVRTSPPSSIRMVVQTEHVCAPCRRRQKLYHMPCQWAHGHAMLSHDTWDCQDIQERDRLLWVWL